MFLDEMEISGFKGFGETFRISFNQGINILVGENSSGKSAVVDAIRMLMNENEFGRASTSDQDFHRPFSKPKNGAKSIDIKCVFDGLSKNERTAFLPWSTGSKRVSLSLSVDNKQNNKGFFTRKVWGGDSHSSLFEWELFDSINCVYLPPLRDAEFKLKEGRYSRLARLLRKLNKDDIDKSKKGKTLHPLEEDVKNFNETLSKDKTKAIYKANQVIKGKLKDAMGVAFGQETLIQFSEVNFDRIVENLRLLFFPKITGSISPEMFRSLEENSLGYNNLLYLATVLAELTSNTDDEYLKLLLIEEPEAHLHPQLQTKLLNYLELTAQEKNVQVIVTTHSPVFSSAISVEYITHLQRIDESSAVATPISRCGLSAESLSFINRWIDLTKSTVFFSKGVILVEGIAEALLLPDMAEQVIREYNAAVKKGEPLKIGGSTLEELGVSVINLNGIYFKHFMQLFCSVEKRKGENIPQRCAGITDNDPSKFIKIDENTKIPSAPTPSKPLPGKNHALKIVDEVNKSEWARLYANQLKTFEYDLAFEGENAKYMAEVLLSIWPSEGGTKKKRLTEISKMKLKNLKDEDERAIVANDILKAVENPMVGKGLFAQILADRIRNAECKIVIPEYIRKAVIWACGGPSDAA
ncbi:AAA family ATPase [Pseudodesulfovibrio indicus]|uniref:ATP-dependent nuclease n=1 Tax=Pseudodesulfovibrio indicus TaxID=1716143 RepID=UPI00292CDBBA|nr:AAA family ATPase [Pseudodesulfovibrio indicus]